MLPFMEKIILDGKTFNGAKIATPKGTILVITSPNGVLACGYFNLATADKLGDAMAIVTGVKSFDDMLAAKIVNASEAAKAAGIVAGVDTGRSALLKL